MEKLELGRMGLTPMNRSECERENGGFFIPAALAFALIASAIDNFGDIRQGFSDGYNLRPPSH
jgi:hypothetical protein